MQLVIFAIFFFIVIGGVGMYFGNRKVDGVVAKQRWLKYAAYILITSLVVISIWFHFFLFIACLIVSVGYYELIRTARTNKQSWLASIIYTLIAAGFIFYMLNFRKEFQLFIYLQILTFDAFSQVTGQLIGKTPITPKISPSKTFEGFFGGMFFCILSSALTGSLINISFFTAIVFGLVTSITGFAGDILASFYKRIAGIKDFSNLLPGQGGFLDRFDSFMMSTFCYSVISLIAPNIFPS